MPRLLTGLVIAILGAFVPITSGSGEGRSFTITAGGDILIHRAIAQLADSHAPGEGVYDFTPMLEPIEPWVGEADLAICHLEGALDPENTGLSYYPRFNAPHEVAEALAAAGYDACSTAGNHTLDHGFAGLADTLAVLDEAGIRHAGSARDPEERLPNLYEVNGVVVGHLAYTYGTNGLSLPEDRPWAVNVIGDGEGILADARWAREHGAEYVIVSMHWGAEYQTAPTGAQVALAERLLASSDVDLILGTHVHVVQPMGWVGDKLVVYGMGNEIANMWSYDGHTGTEDGILVHLTVREQGDRLVTAEVAYTPTWVHPVTKQVVPVAHTLAYGPEDYGAALAASLSRSVARVTMLGAAGVALSPTPWPAVACGGQLATLVGTPGPDRLLGTAGPDVIAARGGDDWVEAGAGDDLVCGASGADTVLAGSGNDVLLGGAGDDRLAGLEGDDRLHGQEGDDRLSGDDGDDVLFGGEGADVLFGGDDEDFLLAQDGDDLLFAGTGDDHLYGGPGSDSLYGSGGTDTCREGAARSSCER